MGLVSKEGKQAVVTGCYNAGGLIVARLVEAAQAAVPGMEGAEFDEQGGMFSLKFDSAHQIWFRPEAYVESVAVPRRQPHGRPKALTLGVFAAERAHPRATVAVDIGKGTIEAGQAGKLLIASVDAMRVGALVGEALEVAGLLPSDENDENYENLAAAGDLTYLVGVACENSGTQADETSAEKLVFGPRVIGGSVSAN